MEVLGAAGGGGRAGRYLAGVAPAGVQREALNWILAAGPGKFEGGMTPRKYIALTKAKYVTANRDLVAKRLLVREGAGSSTHYTLTIPGWGWAPKSFR